MKQNRRTVRLFSLFTGVLLLLTLWPVTVSAAETETVRVGFFAFDGYHMQDDEQNRSGYGYDLMQKIAGYAGLRCNFVGYDKAWSEMQDMLELGEIDLLSSAQKTPEREARFDFSSTPVGTSSAILTIKAGNTAYQAQNYAGWDGMRVGMIEGNSRNADFAEFAAANGFTYESVYLADTDEMVGALQQGVVVDAIVSSNLRRTTGETVLAQFASSPFYIMVQKGNTALLNKINAALDAMDSCEAGFRTLLMNKYYDTAAGVLSFTMEEHAFIESSVSTTFTALVEPDAQPYSYRDEDGQAAGVLPAIIREVAARSGLHIEFLMPATHSEYLALSETDQWDICFDVPDNYYYAEQSGYWQSAPYISLPTSRLHRGDVSEYYSAALLKESDIALQLEQELSQQGIECVGYDSVAQIVEAVEKGRQDMALLPSGIVSLAVWNDITNQLMQEEYYGVSTTLAVGVRQSCDPMLFSVVNKTVAALGEEYLNDVSQTYTVREEKPVTLIGYLYDHPLNVVIILVVLVLLIALSGGVAYSTKRRKEAVARMQAEQRQADLLRDALASAEKAGRAKSQFLSRVSHEMRTPLNAIIGFLALSKDAPPAKIHEYVDNSELAARQLVSVINDVLDMSSIDAGKMKITAEPFDFRQLIYAITNLYVSQCSAKGISYETKLLTPTDEWLVGDQLRVNQILINLLGNAVKFTESGGVSLRITQKLTDEQHVFMRFEVSDTGCGMSEEMQQRLFQPFEQEDASTAQKYGGSGLGLSIVKNLTALMDGAVRVESTRGVGTTFIVDLPFGRSEAHSNMPELQDVNTLHVLAVDDDATEREYVSIVLRRIGVRFSCVETGTGALDELERASSGGDPYNVCLVDWKMPSMDGAETTRRIRAKYGKGVIVIVVSAYNHEQADESARKAGANLFIPKPLFQSSLFDLFMTLTGGKITRREAVVSDYHFTGKHLLLAEDNEMNRVVAQAIVEKMGMTCTTAADGRIAYDLFMASAAGEYDAILMDMQMPNLGGMEATQMIRASSHPDAGRIQIIALTANAFNEDVTKALSAGMNAHVAKPIDIDELAKALNNAFSAGKE